MSSYSPSRQERVRKRHVPEILMASECVMSPVREENSIQKNREEEKEQRIGGGLRSFVIAEKL